MTMRLKSARRYSTKMGSSSELTVFVNSSTNSIHHLRCILIASVLERSINQVEVGGDPKSIKILLLPNFERVRQSRLITQTLKRFGRRKPVLWNLRQTQILGSTKKDTTDFVGAKIKSLAFFSLRGGLFDFTCFRSSGRVKLDNGISIEWISLSIFSRIEANLYSWCWLLGRWSKSGFRPSKIRKEFRSETFQGVIIGDLALAHALRYHRKAGGDPLRVKGYLSSLRTAVYQCQYLNRINVQSTDLLIPGERTYLSWVYSRAIDLKGGKIVSLGDAGQLRLCSSTEAELAVSRVERITVTASTLEAASRSLAARVLGSEENYRWGSGSVQETESFTGISSIWKVSDLSEFHDKKIAVVFLHSFNDGIFYHGIDGFDGFFDWATTIVETLCKTSIDYVLIKPHPNAVLGTSLKKTHGADWYGQKYLFERFQKSSRIFFCNPKLTSSDFEVVREALFVSHSGNIVPELAFLDRCVLSSICSPWGDDFRFSYLYSNATELYDVIEQQLEKEDFKAPINARNEAIHFTACKNRQMHLRQNLDPSQVLKYDIQAYGFTEEIEFKIRGNTDEEVSKLITHARDLNVPVDWNPQTQC